MPERRYPLTPLQKGMVYQSLRSPQSGLYVQQLAGRLREPLDVASFKGAWSRLIAHHAVLRTRIHLADGSDLCQEVEPDAPPEWTDEDWSTLPAEEREARFRRFLDDDRRRAFDFSAFPLLRLALFRLADDDIHFVWTYHHALLDAPSRTRVLEELFGLYDALRRGDDCRLADPPSFRAFVEWLTGQDFHPARDFWLEFLNGFENLTRLDLAPSRSRARADFSRGHQDCVLSGEDTRTLRAFAARHDVTLGTLVQVSWAVLLSRYSGQDDVLFGATRACRRSSIDGAESVVGLLINTVPMRVRLPPDLGVIECLKNVRADWVAMRGHEHTPLRDIQAWSGFGPERPLFENLLAIEDHDPAEKLRSLGGDWQRRDFQLFERSDYPLIGRAYAGTRLSLRVAYAHQTLDHDEAAARMLGHWRTILMGLVTHADRRLVDLPLLTDDELSLMHVRWNSTQRQLSAPSCLHQLFEAQVAKTPAAVALRLEAETVAYEELNARANRLARYLQDIGVKPESLVAICMGRSADLITAILAVLKSGGAYLPIDPDYPKEQIFSMLEDSHAAVMVTEDKYLHLVPSGGVTDVGVDSCATQIARCSSDNLRASVAPDNLAYAMYTSGSTGPPKLIGVEHRGAVNAIAHTTSVVFSPEELAVIPFADSICFDASVYRIFSPLSCGGSIIILDSILSLPYSRWAALVTALGSAPSVLNNLLRNFALPESVRVISVGAEVAGEDLLARLTAYPQIDRVLNLYGPTEATIYCAFSVLMKRQARSDGSGASMLSRVVEPNVIGKPIWNTQCHILDAHLRPVPIGVVGELCIGGAPVARGYLNDAALTATRYVPDFSSGDGSGRVYRTGDLAHYLPDGNIVFVGRLDHQIKVRGVRIEPQGVEAALNRHPDVAESLVRGVEDADGEKQLVAYAAISPEVAGAPQPAVTQRLRMHLERMLPRYMVPGSFVLLDKLPRTSRGKLDVAALPLPDFGRAPPSPPFAAPRTEVEETLAQIWKQVLRLDCVGVDDDFFDIGGDSLYATQVVIRVNRAFGVDLAVRAIFDAPTIASLGALLSERISSGA
jgi:amino acid adenylation domain-containing protein